MNHREKAVKAAKAQREHEERRLLAKIEADEPAYEHEDDS